MVYFPLASSFAADQSTLSVCARLFFRAVFSRGPARPCQLKQLFDRAVYIGRAAAAIKLCEAMGLETGANDRNPPPPSRARPSPEDGFPPSFPGKVFRWRRQCRPPRLAAEMAVARPVESITFFTEPAFQRNR